MHVKTGLTNCSIQLKCYDYKRGAEKFSVQPRTPSKKKNFHVWSVNHILGTFLNHLIIFILKTRYLKESHEYENKMREDAIKTNRKALKFNVNWCFPAIYLTE